MKPNILHLLGDNYLFNEMLKGNKPCCAVGSKHMAQFARELDLKVHRMPWSFGYYYSISNNRKVKSYFQVEDVVGIVNTEVAHMLYNRIKNKNPADAFKYLQREIKNRGEIFEISVLNGMLCGYPICDIVEYIERSIKRKNLSQKGSVKKYYKLIDNDYRIQHVQCAYCRKQYIKYGI